MKEEIRKFIVNQFLFGEETELADEASLLEMGVVDSTGVLELVSHLEKTYGIKVADEELVPENLDSIQSIVDYLQRKQAKPAVVAQGGAHVTGSDVTVSGLGQLPVGIAFHAKRPPDLLRQIGRQIIADRRT